MHWIAPSPLPLSSPLETGFQRCWGRWSPVGGEDGGRPKLPLLGGGGGEQKVRGQCREGIFPRTPQIQRCTEGPRVLQAKEKPNLNIISFFTYLIWLCWVFLRAQSISSCGPWSLELTCSVAESHRLCSWQQVGSNYLTRDGTPGPDLGAWSLSHSVTREVPPQGLKKQIKNLNVLTVAPIGEVTYSSLQSKLKKIKKSN